MSSVVPRSAGITSSSISNLPVRKPSRNQTSDEAMCQASSKALRGSACGRYLSVPIGMPFRTRRVVSYSFWTCGRRVSTRNLACSGVTIVLFLVRFLRALKSLQNSEGHLHYASKLADRARGAWRQVADVLTAGGAEATAYKDRHAAALIYWAGFHRRIGLRAAATSSRRPTRVEWGAVFTRSGVASASAAMERIASMNRSHSCFDSDSVGSIIMAPGTMSGKAVV